MLKLIQMMRSSVAQQKLLINMRETAASIVSRLPSISRAKTATPPDDIIDGVIDARGEEVRGGLFLRRALSTVNQSNAPTERRGGVGPSVGASMNDECRNSQAQLAIIAFRPHMYTRTYCSCNRRFVLEAVVNL